MNRRRPPGAFPGPGALLPAAFLLLPAFSRAISPSPAGRPLSLLRVRVVDSRGEVPRSGVLLVGRSPIGSFPGLRRLLHLPPQVREVPFRFGRARIPLPEGLPVALAWKGTPGWTWQGPFFGGQTVQWKASRPSSLFLRLSLPRKARARVSLETFPLEGTGVSRLFRVSGSAPGVFRLSPLPPGKARLFLEVEGRAPLERRIFLPEGQTLTLSLVPPRGAVLEGRILAPQKGGALPEKALFLLDGRPFSWVRAAGDGRFRLEGVPVDGRAHRIEVSLPHSPSFLIWWTPEKTGQVRHVKVLLPQPFFLEGKILLPGGEPARGIPLALLGRRMTSLGWVPWVSPGRTGPSGEWSLPAPPTPERAVLLVPSGTGGPWGLHLAPHLGEKKRIFLGTLSLPLGTRVFGKVPGLSSREAQGARVEILPAPGSPGPGDLLKRTTPLSPGGAFLFLGVGRGIHLLRVRAPGRAGIQRILRIGAAPVSLEIPLPRGLCVQGRVLLEGGKGAPGARILLEPLAEGWIPVVVLADSKGRFLARGVPPVPSRVTATWTKKGFHWSARVLFPGKPGTNLVLRLFREP